MAKRHYSSEHKGINVSTEVHTEDWDRPSTGVPEIDLGDSRQGLDETIRGNDAKKSKIKPRSV